MKREDGEVKREKEEGEVEIEDVKPAEPKAEV